MLKCIFTQADYAEYLVPHKKIHLPWRHQCLSAHSHVSRGSRDRATAEAAKRESMLAADRTQNGPDLPRKVWFILLVITAGQTPTRPVQWQLACQAAPEASTGSRESPMGLGDHLHLWLGHFSGQVRQISCQEAGKKGWAQNFQC